MKNRILDLLEISKGVILDCALPNGAIIASTCSFKEVKDYKFVWPRDVAYTCIAANLLEIRSIQEKFFSWCMQAEDWAKTGLFYKKYFVNGKKAREEFQPDQTGMVLIALHDYYQDDFDGAKKFENLIRGCAEGLCQLWDKDNFKVVIEDVWEERKCFPDLKDNFSYSLAICYRGLLSANKLIPNKRWVKIAEEMKKTFLKTDQDYFFRSFGKINDLRVDASLLGLVWPAQIIKANDKMMKKTINLIEEKIVHNFGVYRYEGDDYDGWMYKDLQRKKGAGYWPLLNFWMSIYYLELGDKKKAKNYFDRVIDDLDSNEIPEQIFGNKLQVSVSPLCWAHAMFVILVKKFGMI